MGKPDSMYVVCGSVDLNFPELFGNCSDVYP